MNFLVSLMSAAWTGFIILGFLINSSVFLSNPMCFLSVNSKVLAEFIKKGERAQGRGGGKSSVIRIVIDKLLWNKQEAREWR